MQVNTNGMVSFGSSYNFKFYSSSFPIKERVISPYWNEQQDFRSKGSISYFSVTPAHPTLASTLVNASMLISSMNDVDFEASWMFVVRWIDSCPFENDQCTQVSSKIVLPIHAIYCEYRVNLLYRETATRLFYSLMVHNPILCLHTSVVNSTGTKLLPALDSVLVPHCMPTILFHAVPMSGE